MRVTVCSYDVNDSRDGKVRSLYQGIEDAVSELLELGEQDADVSDRLSDAIANAADALAAEGHGE